MFTRIRDLLARSASRLPAVLALGALGAVAAAGYVNDWKLPPFLGGPAAPPPDQSEPAAPGKTSGAAAPEPTGRTIRLSADALRKAGVEVQAVRERPMTRRVHAHGTLAYDQTLYARLSARAEGVVWQIYRQPGDAVHAGDVLAVVESAEIGKAKAALLQSLMQAEGKERALDALQATATKTPDLVPELQLREAELQLREARASLFADQQALLNYELPVTAESLVGQPVDQVVRRLRLLGLPDEIVRRLDPETATANLMPITAPFDGVVVSRDTAVGEEASPRRPLFAVADLRKVWVTCEVRLEDVGLLAPGQEIVVRPDGADADAPPGTVVWVGAEADEKTHTVQARAEVANPEGRLRPNTPFEGSITVRRNPRAAAVPDEAVQWDEGNAVVFVRVSDGAFEPRQVQVGLRDDGYSELLSGAAPGETIVTRGSHVLKAEWLKARILQGD